MLSLRARQNAGRSHAPIAPRCSCEATHCTNAAVAQCASMCLLSCGQMRWYYKAIVRRGRTAVAATNTASTTTAAYKAKTIAYNVWLFDKPPLVPPFLSLGVNATCCYTTESITPQWGKQSNLNTLRSMRMQPCSACARGALFDQKSVPATPSPEYVL